MLVFAGAAASLRHVGAVPCRNRSPISPSSSATMTRRSPGSPARSASPSSPTNISPTRTSAGCWSRRPAAGTSLLLARAARPSRRRSSATRRAGGSSCSSRPTISRAIMRRWSPRASSFVRAAQGRALRHGRGVRGSLRQFVGSRSVRAALTTAGAPPKRRPRLSVGRPRSVGRIGVQHEVGARVDLVDHMAVRAIIDAGPPSR